MTQTGSYVSWEEHVGYPSVPAATSAKHPPRTTSLCYAFVKLVEVGGSMSNRIYSGRVAATTARTGVLAPKLQ